MPFVEGFGGSHNVLGHQPGASFGKVHRYSIDDRKIFGRDHGGHTRQGFSFAGVYTLNNGMGVRTSQDFPVQHA